MYIMSLILSLFTMIMCLFISFSDSETTAFRFFGDTEILCCLVLSIIFIIIGMRIDNVKNKEKYGQ